MIHRLSDVLNVLRSGDENILPPDILAASSEVICDIIREYMPADTEKPLFVQPLSWKNYFDEQVTGALAIKIIQHAWMIDRKRFAVDPKINEIRYNAGQTYDASRILKELPEDLEPRQSREWVCMNLPKAREFFKIDFRKSWWRIIP